MSLGADIETLARTIWGEARGELHAGMIAVGWVVRNRASDELERWPKTIEAVCRQKSQFSCWNSNDPNSVKLRTVDVSNPAFRQCLRAAVEVICGSLDPTKGANHYLTIALAESKPPKWYDPDKVRIDIGHHRFLRL